MGKVFQRNPRLSSDPSYEIKRSNLAYINKTPIKKSEFFLCVNRAGKIDFADEMSYNIIMYQNG